MGSAFAAVKAGILAGIFYACSVGVFNTALLYIFKGSTLQSLSQAPQCSGGVVGTLADPEACFSALVSVLIPIEMFDIVIIAIIFAALFGVFFERLPGQGYRTKAGTTALLTLLVLLLFRSAGVGTDSLQAAILFVFDLIVTYMFAVMLGSFYRRYTREVVFQSDDSESLRVVVDRRDLTGTMSTFSARSSHTVRAQAQGKSFKVWLVSGGVTVEDEKSFETVMKVNGDGMLKASLAQTV